MYRKQEGGFQTDYCLVPVAWTLSLKSVHVGSYADWCHLSDYYPLVIEFN